MILGVLAMIVANAATVLGARSLLGLIRVGKRSTDFVLFLLLRLLLISGFELIETWWVVFLHHDVLIELAGVEFLLLSGAGAYALAREMGWSGKCASRAALLFIMTPGLHLQATSCLNDGPVAALITAMA